MKTTDKFRRNYHFTVQVEDGGREVIVEPPFTLQLDITRNLLEASNVCQVRLYNLSKLRRNQIYFNQNDYAGGFFRRMTLKAGYGDDLSTIFIGNVSQAWSSREGTNFITQVESFDGSTSMVNDDVALSFNEGTTIQKVIETLMSKLSNVTIGAIGKFDGVLTRPNTYKGNPTSLLFELTGGGFFIDKGKAYAIKTDEYVPDTSFETKPTIIIDSSTGLLNTPILERNIARVEMLFEPTLNPGRQVRIESSTFERLNGVYKINSVKHRGIISDATSGELITIAEFYKPKDLVKAEVITP